MKGERMAKRTTLGSIMRKRLSDITNLPSSQPKILNLSHEEKPSQAPPSTEDVINQLIKEKMTLMKLVEERNKIIEFSGNELRDLRINLQKLQMQNWNLAQSNSQFLAELNFGREKLKALQHELVCKDALLKAKNTEKEEKMDMNCANTGSQGSEGKKEMKCENTGSQVSKEEEKAAAECLPNANDNDKPCTRNRRRATSSKSMGPSTTHRQAAEKEKVENKRRCLRRQSARFQSQEREPAENLFEIEDTKLLDTLPPNDPMHEDFSTPAGSSVANKETCSTRSETQVSKRSSIGRPLRLAAEKVQSYKEVPLNEIKDTKLPDTPPPNDPMQEDVSTPAGSSSVPNKETCSSRNETQASQRSSMGRPLRRAAEKVQSYKEVPLNIKMRR
ncbi:hypothetical protein Ddye_025221 [Dipteronia dyeriana]|uniref:Shugoshin C-terminal domain-containing protein n=1 Tax=Dipteronia dyeriana TaxID=168575 RepID=A0AAD9WUX6_9ROSI|nr:hypothetical protein Ddye_025221 [Dipteronia dyeriana]